MLCDSLRNLSDRSKKKIVTKQSSYLCHIRPHEGLTLGTSALVTLYCGGQFTLIINSVDTTRSSLSPNFPCYVYAARKHFLRILTICVPRQSSLWSGFKCLCKYFIDVLTCDQVVFSFSGKHYSVAAQNSAGAIPTLCCYTITLPRKKNARWQFD